MEVLNDYFEVLDQHIQFHYRDRSRLLDNLFPMHSPARVVSIAPDGQLFDRICSYCTEHGISDAPLEKYVEGSQWALPRIAARSDPVFDFALVDGQHGWPMVFVDFYYVNYLVRPGGFIMLDDTQLYSVNELVKLLHEQAGL
jgi:hypothetical protein